MISLRRLVSRLAVLALSGSPAAAGADPAPTAQDCELDGDVPIDRGQVSFRDAAMLLGDTLARALAEMHPLDATHLATTWALSDEPVRRLAVVKALARVQPLGTRSVLDHLARDPDPAVRAAAHQAKPTSARRT